MISLLRTNHFVRINNLRNYENKNSTLKNLKSPSILPIFKYASDNVYFSRSHHNFQSKSITLIKNSLSYNDLTINLLREKQKHEREILYEKILSMKDHYLKHNIKYSPRQKIIHIDRITKSIKELYKFEHPNFEILRNQLEKLIHQEYLSLFPIYEKYRSELKDGNLFVSNLYIDSMHNDDFISYLIYKEQMTRITIRSLFDSPIKIPPDEIKRRYLYGLLASKHCIKKENIYDKMNYGAAHAYIIPHMLNILSCLDLNNPPFLEKHIKNTIIPLLEKYLFITTIPKNQKWCSHILEALLDLKLNDNLLIPVGNVQHATCVLITKSTHITYKLIHFETDIGFHKYPRDDLSNRIITFYEIKNIPANSILTYTSWDTLLNLMVKEVNINPIHDHLKTVISKDGIETPIPLNKESFDTRQGNGACVTQCLMAFLRYSIMDIAEGSLAEKEAVYKFFKSKLYLASDKIFSPKVDLFTRQHIQPSVNKALAELILYQIACDPKEFSKALGLFSNTLQKYPNETTNEILVTTQASTTFSSYAMLRKFSNLLVKSIKTNPSIALPEFMQSEPAFVLVKAKLNLEAYRRDYNLRMSLI